MSFDQQPKEKYYDWIDITQLVISILVFSLSLIWLAATGLAAFGFNTLFFGGGASVEPGALINLGLTGLILMAVTLVSTVTTIQKITGHARTTKPATDRLTIFSMVGFVVIFGLAALTGLASQPVKSIALAVLSVPGIAIPVYWLLRYGTRDWWARNPKRDSGMATFSFGVTIPYIILIESLMAVFLIIIFILGLFNNAQFAELFNTILSDPSLLEGNAGSLYSEFEAILSIPNLIGWLLLVIAGIMPLIEELFKTLGVWVLQIRNPRPIESFLAGLLSGGGFALFEGLLSLNSLQLSEIGYNDWAGLILGRFGGSLLHILTGGIIGLAIGRFWQERKFGSLLLAYLASWLLHAAWNTLAVFGGISPLIHGSQVESAWPYVGMVLLFIGMIFAFISLTKKAHGLDGSRVLSSGPGA